MVQPSVARIFMADPLAADTGFLPRFLMCEPQSTIGSRLQTNTKRADMELEVFSSRMRHILAKEMPMDDQTHALGPRVLELSADHVNSWQRSLMLLSRRKVLAAL